jgi:hypothetical protein
MISTGQGDGGHLRLHAIRTSPSYSAQSRSHSILRHPEEEFASLSGVSETVVG